jgi:PilZ domain-containing protein
MQSREDRQSANRRRDDRQAVNRPARIELEGGKTYPCRIADISRGGALLLIPDSDSLPAVFQILDLHENTKREVRKVWTRPNRAGVAYTDSEDQKFGNPVRSPITFGKRSS